MQSLDDELQNTNAVVDKTKEQVKTGSRELERLRVERAELEKKVRAQRDQTEDTRVVGLYEWSVFTPTFILMVLLKLVGIRFQASLALHRRLFRHVSYTSPSENELHITCIAQSSPRIVIIMMIFVPNTRRLADAHVEGLETEAGDVVDAYVQANDVHGLIAAILARARAGS